MSKSSVFIIYGFGEGDWNGIVFRRALERAGFTMSHNAEQADIVIAHSAGCFYLPHTSRKQLTVLIGPPYWPGHSVAANFCRKAWSDLRAYHRDRTLLAWLDKTARNSLYILGGLRKATLIARNARRHNFYVVLEEKDVKIIRPEHDAFLTPDAPVLLQPHARFQFYTVPGHQHDDLWRYPMPYVSLLQLFVKGAA